MANENGRSVPLTCHGHSRPVPHISFSPLEKNGDNYYMISACKDGNPMLRDGQTGDWIGTFIGHKGAVWQAKLSPDASSAATASMDYTVKVWDTHTGELLYELEHENRVRTIAYPYDNSGMLATGGNEGKLRIWDLQEAAQTQTHGATTTTGESDTGTTNANNTSNTTNGNGSDPSKEAVAVTPIKVKPHMAFEIGTGAHTEKDGIKFIVWPKDQTTLITAAAGNTLRWFDIPSRNVVKAVSLDGEIKSCELVALAPKYSNPATDIGEGQPVMAVAAGKTASFWGGVRCDKLIKKMTFPRPIASVSIDLKGRKVFVGEDDPNTWVRVYSWDDESEIDVHKGHHGPVWSIAVAPDGKLYATGSEDGTIKMWKNTDGFYGLWRGGGTPGPGGSDRVAAAGGAGAAD